MVRGNRVWKPRGISPIGIFVFLALAILGGWLLHSPPRVLSHCQCWYNVFLTHYVCPICSILWLTFYTLLPYYQHRAFRWTSTTSPKMWLWGTWWIFLRPPLSWLRAGSTPWWRKTPSVASCGLSSIRNSSSKLTCPAAGRLFYFWSIHSHRKHF